MIRLFCHFGNSPARVGPVALLLFFLPNLARGQATGEQAWALDIHGRVRSHYIRQDTIRLEQLTDSVCAIQPLTPMARGACAECRGFGHLLYKQFEQAGQAYEQAAGYFAQAAYPYLEAQGLNNAGWAASCIQQHTQADSLYERAARVLTDNATERADSILLCYVYSNQITIYEVIANYILVFDKAIQMLELAEQIPDTGQIASALESLMLVYRKFGEMDNAQQYKDQLCRIYETPGKYYNPIESMAHKMFFVQSEQEAEAYLHRAEDYLAKASGSGGYGIEQVYYNYALAMDRFNQPERAALYYQKTIDTNQGRFEFTRFSTFWSYIYLADIAIQQEQYPKALAIGREILPQIENMEDLSMQRELLTQLSTAFFHTGQIDSAYLYLQQASLLQDSIAKTSNDKDFMRTHMEYVFEQEQEIQRLQRAQEQALVAAQVLRQRQLLIASLVSLGLLGAFLYYYRRNYKSKLASEKRLQAANQQLQRSNQKLDRFANSISHDILSNIDLLLSTGNILVEPHHNPSSLQHYYRQSKQTLSSTKDYCLQLLKSARERDGQATQEADTNSILQQALEHNKLALDTYAPEVTYDTLPPLPIPEGDLLQVFQNLLSNAIAFAGPQPDGHIAIRTENTPSEIRIGVLDNGPGIPEDQLESVFEQGISFKQDGNGQGLAFVRDIVESYGGRVWAERSALGGAGVWIAFSSALHRSGNHLMLN